MLAQRAPAPCLTLRYPIFTASDTWNRARNPRSPHEPARRPRTEAGEKAKAGRGHKRAGHSRPPRPCARLVCLETVSGLRYLVYRRGPGSDRGDRRIALRARREPLDSTPLDRNPADRGPEGAQMLLVGVSTARTVVSLYDPIRRASYLRASCEEHTYNAHNVGPRNE